MFSKSDINFVINISNYLFLVIFLWLWANQNKNNNNIKDLITEDCILYGNNEWIKFDDYILFLKNTTPFFYIDKSCLFLLNYFNENGIMDSFWIKNIGKNWSSYFK